MNDPRSISKRAAARAAVGQVQPGDIVALRLHPQRGTRGNCLPEHVPRGKVRDPQVPGHLPRLRTLARPGGPQEDDPHERAHQGPPFDLIDDKTREDRLRSSDAVTEELPVDPGSLERFP